MKLKEMLAKKLTKKELALVPSSFDIVGNKEKAVAVIEIPEKLKRKKIIANALMKKHKNVKTVLIKKSERKGIFRLYDFDVIGEKNTEVMHVESGCRFLLDPQKVYFSPREGSERLRIATQIKENENIMIFFAGVGPYAIIIAKKKPVRIVGIEINPIAVEYFKKNIRLNKLNNIDVVLGDVKNLDEKFYNKFDRVIMPLPESSVNYIAQALLCLKKNGICNLYCFAKEDEIKKIKAKIKNIAKKQKRRIKFINIIKVKQWGPRIYKYRIDFVTI